MIQKYKDFWKQYSPYKLHPKDADIISQFSGTDELVVDLSLHMLEEKYDDFKNGNNNIKFLKDINLNAIGDKRNIVEQKFKIEIHNDSNQFESIRVDL